MGGGWRKPCQAPQSPAFFPFSAVNIRFLHFSHKDRPPERLRIVSNVLPELPHISDKGHWHRCGLAVHSVSLHKSCVRINWKKADNSYDEINDEMFPQRFFWLLTVSYTSRPGGAGIQDLKFKIPQESIQNSGVRIQNGIRIRLQHFTDFFHLSINSDSSHIPDPLPGSDNIYILPANPVQYS